MKTTCRKFADTFNIDYLQASSIIKMLIKTGVACEGDSIKCQGRGRPTVQYIIPTKVKINFETGAVEDDTNTLV